MHLFNVLFRLVLAVYGRRIWAIRDSNAKGKNLIEDIKEQVTANMSSVDHYNNAHTSWNSSNAIDGRTGDPNTCGCCSGTFGEEPPWWQLDLGKKYLIDKIIITGGNSEHSSDLWIFVSDHSMTDINGSLVKHDNAPIHFQLSPPRLFRFLIIRKNEKKQMIICEVKLHESECSVNTFGASCEKSCHCVSGTSCYNSEGYLSCDTCAPGWRGNMCSDKECDKGWYGNNCSKQCGQCARNETCDFSNGTCPLGCKPGYFGVSCEEECNKGWYGNNCSKQCGQCARNEICYFTNGTCPLGCNPGYFGVSCEEETFPESENKTSLSESSVGIAVGISAAALVVIGVFVGSTLILQKRIRNSRGQYREEQSRYMNEVGRQGENMQTSDSADSQRLSGHISAAYASNDLHEENLIIEDAKDDKETREEYYKFTDFVGVRIHEVWDFIQEKKANDCKGFYAEFKRFPCGLQHLHNTAVLTENIGKNRYKGLCAYDHTRVVLEVELDEGTDYINASYIDGFEKTKKFVASQGPTSQMVHDFWRMVWQLKSNKIVMLTDLVEMAPTKCVQYWPANEGCCWSYGNVFIKLINIVQDLDYTTRNLECWKDGEKPRRIRHFHFRSWPDKDVPDNTWSLVKFWRAVKTDTKTKAGPIIVHCSAGVGRTGTFIALDNLVHQARMEGCVRPFQIVLSLREQRVNMVQTKEQYVYLHEVLADALLFGTHFVWDKQFEEMYRSMLQKEVGGTKIRLQVQFDLIQESIGDTRSGEARTVEYTNARALQSESQDYKPKLKTGGFEFVQQLEAVFIPNYAGKNTFLLAKSPVEGATEKLWSLVDSLNAKTVVVLTDTSDTYKLPLQTSCNLEVRQIPESKFTMQKTSETPMQGYVKRTYTLRTSNGEISIVRQFQFTAWQDGENVPVDTCILIDFLEAILQWQPHMSQSQPILIMCSNGYSRSGIVSVALNELQRIRAEGGIINIVESVKMMKQRNSLLISNFEQYKFCYDLILTYLKPTEIYQNV